ncbi:polysaccharide lyase [Aquimarina sp. 2304DJ70-9]|uniref:polysaccharide lyase n=1 Tax=Aquimarina penaris TaxID=3231044 RepID=UPI0034636146
MKLFTQRNLISVVSLFVTITFFAQNPIYQNDFDHLSTGQYNEEEMKEALGAHFCKGADEGRISISEYQGRGNVLKVKYPKGKVKTNDSGMHTKVYWDNYASFDELYFSYQVYIPQDFEFRAGAKLPGLAYQTRDQNMSLRLMWRKDGLLEFYNHFETRPTWDGWTASVNWSLLDPYDERGGPQPDQVKLKKGAWNHIEVFHKLNTPGKNNGIMRGWFNGQLAIDITDNGDYRQNGEGNIGINNIYLSTFFGGSSNDYKPTKDLYAYFDDFIVSKTRIGDNTGDGTDQSFKVSFKTPAEDLTVQEGYDLEIEVDAKDNNGSIKEVKLYINNSFVRRERRFPYTWGHQGSPNPNELNGLSSGVYTIKAVATNSKGKTKETSFKLTVKTNSTCSFVLPDTKGLEPLDNVLYNYVHITGAESPGFMRNFVNFSAKWNPKYDALFKFALQTNNGTPDWYVDFSKTATFQLKETNPEITLRNTGFEGLDGSYWVTMQNEELVLKSKHSQKLLCFSNSAKPPACMRGKSQQVITVHNSQRLVLDQNPIKDILSIKDLPTSAYRVDVYSLNGNIIHSESISAKQSHLDVNVNELPNGIYFLQVHARHQEALKTKFVKNE